MTKRIAELGAGDVVYFNAQHPKETVTEVGFIDTPKGLYARIYTRSGYAPTHPAYDPITVTAVGGTVR